MFHFHLAKILKIPMIIRKMSAGLTDLSVTDFELIVHKKIVDFL